LDSSLDRGQWGEHYQLSNGVDPCIRGSLKRFGWNQRVFCDLKDYNEQHFHIFFNTAAGMYSQLPYRTHQCLKGIGPPDYIYFLYYSYF
jgi:hypothetical protein